VSLEERRLACALRVIGGHEVANDLPLLDDGNLDPGQRHGRTVSKPVDHREFNPRAANLNFKPSGFCLLWVAQSPSARK
jgi:hypothetical protein